MSTLNLSFDEDDANLFDVEDLRLRADALRHSVLPRLQSVMNEAVTKIREIYQVEVLEDSIISVSPNFRQKRDAELKLAYESVSVGLGGHRKAKWPGFHRKDGKPVQILPFTFSFMLERNGMYLVFQNGWLTGLSEESFEKLIRFHIDNEQKINPLCFKATIAPEALWAEDLSGLSTLNTQYKYRLKHKIFDNYFFGNIFYWPVRTTQIDELVENFVAFYPIYDSYIQLAKGLPPRLDELIAKLSAWSMPLTDDGIDPDQTVATNAADQDLQKQAAIAAETKIRVMPAMRWQVFQRDQWRCVACGRNSHAGAILHIDHVIPRSLGGENKIGNYQTLCDVCNIGKSNRDATDLRNKAKP